jgi:ribosomal protein S6
MTHYEFMMILNPTLGEEEINNTLEAVKTDLTAA